MKKFEEYALKIGFEEKNGIFVRQVNEFTIYLRNWQYLIMDIPSFYIPLNKSLTKELIKQMEQAALNNACSSMTFNQKDDVLIISLPDGKKDEEKFKSSSEQILIRVCKLLKIKGYAPLKICPICKKEAEYLKFGDHFIPMHQECMDSHVKKLEVKAIEENKFSIKHLLSIGLSLLFACVGLVPALLCCIYLYGYFTPLLVLVPIGSIGGLFLSKASKPKWLKFITGLIPLLIIVAFSVFSLPYMAQMNQLSFGDYLLSDGWIGIRKIVFSTLFCITGFSGIKFLDKFGINASEEIKKFY